MTMFRDKMEEDLEFVEKLYEAISTLRVYGLQKKHERESRIAHRKLLESFREKFPIYDESKSGYRCFWKYDDNTDSYIPAHTKDGHVWKELNGTSERVKVKVRIVDVNDGERECTGRDLDPKWELIEDL